MPVRGSAAGGQGRPLRVLMVSDVYFPRVNGVSTSIQTFCHGLAEEGVQVTLVAPAYPAGDGAATAAEIVRLPSRAVPRDPEDRLMHWGPLASLDRRLAGADFHAVHIQTPFAAHYAGLRFARRRGIPCLATYHTHFEEYLFHYIPFLPRGLLRGAARALARQQCNALDAVVVPSTPMADTLRDYGVSAPMRVLPTGLPEEQFVRGDGKRFREQHDIGPERRVALFVGRAAHEKNIDFLLDAIALARRTRPELMLVVAGEGPALDGLKAHAARLQIESHVRFVGYLPRESGLRDCYAAADLFVFASLTETQGLVLLEAMAIGLPVLAIPALGAAEIVRPQRGAMAASRAVEAFAGEMLALIESPDRLTHMGRDAVAFAAEWNARSQAGKLAALYRELVRAPHAVEFTKPAVLGQ